MKLNYLFMLLAIVVAIACNPLTKGVIYETDTLKIQQLTPKSFIHVSYLETESFGKVACNGLIYMDHGEVLIFDTPTTDKASEELLNWISSELQATTKSVVVTHAHDDCLGGLSTFHEAGVPSYANQLTLQFASEKEFPVPNHGFTNEIQLQVGEENVLCTFMGEGHTKDNVIGYIPKEKLLFGGCLLKSVGAGKGYVGEANVEEWPKTIDNITNRFDEIEYVVPGHGKAGGTELLDFTKTLFLMEK